MFLSFLGDGRVGKQTHHLAYHAELYEVGFPGEIDAAAYEQGYQKIGPYNVAHLQYVLVQGAFSCKYVGPWAGHFVGKGSVFI